MKFYQSLHCSCLLQTGIDPSFLTARLVTGWGEAELGNNALPNVTTTWFDQFDSGRPIARPTTPAHLQMRSDVPFCSTHMTSLGSSALSIYPKVDDVA